MDKASLLNSIFLLTQTYSVIFISLMVGILSARGLGVADRGTLALLILLTQLCSRLGSIGIEQFIHKYGIEEDEISSLYAVGFLGSILSAPILLIGIMISDVNFLFAGPLILTAALIPILRFTTAIFIHRRDLRYLSIISITQALGQLASYIIVFNTKNLNYFMLAWICNTIIFSLFAGFLSYKKFQRVKLEKTNLASMTSFWRKGFSFSAVAVPEVALTFCLELPVIRSVLGGTQAGFYAISNTLTGLYYQVFASLSAVIAKGGRQSFGVFLYLALAMLCALFMISAKPIINIAFGDKYVEAVGYVYIMLPTTFILGVARIKQMSSAKSMDKSIQMSLTGLLLAIIFLSWFVGENMVVYTIALAYVAYALGIIIFINKDQNKISGGVEGYAKH